MLIGGLPPDLGIKKKTTHLASKKRHAHRRKELVKRQQEKGLQPGEVKVTIKAHKIRTVTTLPGGYATNGPEVRVGALPAIDTWTKVLEKHKYQDRHHPSYKAAMEGEKERFGPMTTNSEYSGQNNQTWTITPNSDFVRSMLGLAAESSYYHKIVWDFWDWIPKPYPRNFVSYETLVLEREKVLKNTQVKILMVTPFRYAIPQTIYRVKYSECKHLLTKFPLDVHRVRQRVIATQENEKGKCCVDVQRKIPNDGLKPVQYDYYVFQVNKGTPNDWIEVWFGAIGINPPIGRDYVSTGLKEEFEDLWISAHLVTSGEIKPDGGSLKAAAARQLFC